MEVGSGSSFIDRDTDHASAVALEEIQDGLGNPLVNSDGSLKQFTSSGSASSSKQEKPEDFTFHSVRVWDAMVYFHALADLVLRIRENTATWDSSNMVTLRNYSSRWCINLVWLDANEEDKQHGIHSSVKYDDVLQSLTTATTAWVEFRNRPQNYHHLKSMLLALVSKGINLYLQNVVAKQGKDVAKMMLHNLCYAGSIAFSTEDLDGRWISNQGFEKGDTKTSEKEQKIAIKYLPRPKLLTEVRGEQYFFQFRSF